MMKTITKTKKDERGSMNDGTREALRKGFAGVINLHSAENGSNTPDFLLAGYLVDCLEAFERTLHARANWYGNGLDCPGGNGPDPVGPRDDK